MRSQIRTPSARTDMRRISAGWEPITDGTVSATATLDLFFTASSWSVVRVYLFDWVPTQDTDDFRMRTSTDGSTFDTGAGDYAWWHHTLSDQGTDAGRGSTGTNGIEFGLTFGNAANEHFSGEVDILNPSSAEHKFISLRGSYHSSAAAFLFSVGGGARLAAADVNGIQFFYSTDTIASGTYKVVGMRN